MPKPYLSSGRFSPLPFVYAAYHLQDDGSFLPAIPTEGPCRAGLGACRICLDHLRDRQTGPGHPILVCRCLTHSRTAFTVYPPGFVPYSRFQVAPVGPDGKPLQEEEGLAAGQEKRDVGDGGPDLAARFRSTFFQAALDAGARTFWKREGTDHSSPRLATQLRHLDLSRKLLGLGEEPGELERRASLLGVETLLLKEASRSFSSWEESGAAVERVLSALPGKGCLLEVLLVAGYQAGIWGSPWLWDERTGRLRDLVIRTTGTTGGRCAV